MMVQFTGGWQKNSREYRQITLRKQRLLSMLF
jgi:hypothetical protein